MNTSTSRSSEKIMKDGGFLYWVPWEEAKKITDVFVAELTSPAVTGATGIDVDQVVGMPATGTIYINGETAPLAYTAITGTHITIAALTKDHSAGEIVEVVQATGATITSYSGFNCLGWTESSMFNAGVPAPNYITTERSQRIQGFSGIAEPKITIVAQQSDIDTMAFFYQKDVSAATLNGATVIDSETQLPDIAAIYVAIRTNPSGVEYPVVFWFPHLKLNGSPDHMFSSEQAKTSLTFDILYDDADQRDYRIAGGK